VRTRRNGDGRIQTPDALARAVGGHFLPCGRIVKPSSGNGAFLRALPDLRATGQSASRSALAMKVYGHLRDAHSVDMAKRVTFSNLEPASPTPAPRGTLE
jgi:hypothetical protein